MMCDNQIYYEAGSSRDEGSEYMDMSRASCKKREVYINCTVQTVDSDRPTPSVQARQQKINRPTPTGHLPFVDMDNTIGENEEGYVSYEPRGYANVTHAHSFMQTCSNSVITAASGHDSLGHVNPECVHVTVHSTACNPLVQAEDLNSAMFSTEPRVSFGDSREGSTIKKSGSVEASRWPQRNAGFHVREYTSMPDGLVLSERMTRQSVVLTLLTNPCIKNTIQRTHRRKPVPTPRLSLVRRCAPGRSSPDSPCCLTSSKSLADDVNSNNEEYLHDVSGTVNAAKFEQDDEDLFEDVFYPKTRPNITKRSKPSV